MTLICPFPGCSETTQPEMSHACGQTLAQRTHRHRCLSGAGQGGETTEILISDSDRHLGIESTDPFEKSGRHLGPDVWLVTTDDDQALGDDTNLPGGLW
jgi:hypothetical protein